MAERSPFYNMFLNMWVMKSVTEESLQNKVPRFISQEEFNAIVATPQNGVIPLDAEAKEANSGE